MIKRIMISLALVTILMAGTGPAVAQKPVRLTFTAGPVGGAWYPLGGAIAEIIKENISGSLVTVTTGGGIGNVPKVEGGLADFGLTQSMLYNAASNGVAPYDKKFQNIRALGYLSFLHQAFFLVREKSPLTSIEQMVKEKYPLKLITTTKLSTPELAARRLLAEYGTSHEEIESWGGKVYFVSFAEAQTLIADGHADAFIGPILGAVRQIITMNKMRLLPWKETAIDNLVKKYGYLKKPIAKDRYYFVKENINHPAEANIVIVRKQLPEDLVYNITKIISENPDRIKQSAVIYKQFDPAEMGKDVGGPLHPGAEKYYKEKGYIK